MVTRSLVRTKKAFHWDVMIFMIAAMLSLFALRQEWVIKRLIEAVSQNNSQLIETVDLSGLQGTSARADFLTAQILARRAAKLPLAERDVILSNAQSVLDRADAARRNWGQSYLVRAYLIGLRSDSVNQQSSDWIERSYRYAPLLYPEGGWRIIYGLAAWSSFRDNIRRDILREAIGLSSIGGHSWNNTRRALKLSPAWQEYLLLSNEPE